MQILLKEKTIYYNIEYSKRKKITMDITPEGIITVKAPTKTSLDQINTFMQQNETLLLAVQERLDNRKFISSQKTYQEEEHFLYLGKAHILSDLLNHIPEEEDAIQTELKRFYTQQTKQLVKKRVAHFESIIGVKSKSITIVDSPKTWGTCNNKKELTFNYKLSMAPLSVIDYVVIHELCHILHLNHDRSFWRKVGMYDENYKEKQNYLAKFGGVMTI